MSTWGIEWKSLYFSFLVCLTIVLVVFIWSSSDIDINLSSDNNTRSMVESFSDVSENMLIYQEELKENATMWERRYWRLEAKCSQELIIYNVDCWDEDNSLMFDCDVQEAIWSGTNDKTYLIDGLGVR